MQYIRTLTQLRTASNYSIEFTLNRNAYLLNPNENCVSCSRDKLETIAHLLLDCPIYCSIKPPEHSNFTNVNGIKTFFDNVDIANQKKM